MEPLPEAVVRRRIAEVYGEPPGEIAALDGEYDVNLRVDAPSGRSVVKVAGPATDPDLVALQAEALRHLAARGVPGLPPLPTVVPTADGRLWADVEIDGEVRRMWRIGWLDGRPLLDVARRSPETLEALGAALARLDGALQGFDHPLLDRPHPWDPARAGWLTGAVAELPEGAEAGLVGRVVEGWPALERRLADLPAAVIHADANDHNVLVDDAGGIAGIFDFGDMVRTRRVCEVAVAAAYAAFGAVDVVAAIGSVVAGYDAVSPLDDGELAVVLDLVRTRLSISVVMSARRRGERPGDPYVTVSEAQAWALLGRLDAVDPTLATARLRDACRRPPFPTGPAVTRWLEAEGAAGRLHPVLGRPLAPSHVTLLDLSVGSRLLGADPATLETAAMGRRIDEAVERAGATVGIGRWDEARPIYLGPAFAAGDHPTDEHRTVHLGIDLFVPPDTPVYAPLDGAVEAVAEHTAAKDYGPVVLLRHEPRGAPRFWTLWGHLDAEVLDRLSPGAPVPAGQPVARVGPAPRNGDWPPHLHLQLVLDPLGRGTDVPGVAPARERSTWKAWFPDPSVLCGLEPGAAAARRPAEEALRHRRRRRLGTGLSLSYGRPLHLVRGWRQYLYDIDGRAYLDLYNNVPHLGHSHPAVADAVARQVALLNTNTRYLHETILDYADALAARLPEALEVVWVVNSASEANELALRLVRAATGRRELIVQEAGYHGHTTGLIDASPYKFDGPGGEGRPEWVEVVPVPDDYRGRFRREGGEAGVRYGDEVAALVRRMVEEGRPPGAFLAETFPSVGGQIVPPAGYLPRAYAAVRAAGGLCVADEVQTGFGRLGDAFWGFELQGVVPDVVVVGKPAGNGMPLGVVVATRAVAEAFDTGMEFFSTFGGNPVSCAAGLAVLGVMDAEGLQENARRVGTRMLDGLAGLAHRFPVLGDVRGRGLFVGVEFVEDRDARTPAPAPARYVVERLREEGILAGTDGPDHNVMKLRGPLVVEATDVDRLVERLGRILAENGARPRA